MAATRPLSRNYPRRSIRSPRQSRKLTSKHLWSSTPSNHYNKKSRSRSRTLKKKQNWNANFPMPSRHSEIGGHHAEQNRPISRGAYQQADFGHLVPAPPAPPPPSSSPPTAAAAAAAATTTVPEVTTTTDPIQQQQQQQQQQRQREPGQSIIVRRPMSPFMPYKKRTSEARQKLALTKLRSLYDGRTFKYFGKKLEKNCCCCFVVVLDCAFGLHCQIYVYM